MKSRIHWVDVARGIGMLFVIYGHTIDDHQYRYLIYAFHMPFFFFLSGMLYRTQSVTRFLSRTLTTLLIPYFFLAVATYVVGLTNVDPHTITLQRVTTDMLGVLYGNGANGGLGYNVILWFIPCLIATRFLFYAIHFFSQHIPPLKLGTVPFPQSSLFLLLFLFSLIGYGFVTFLPDVHLPFGLESALSAVVFYGAGFALMSEEKLRIWIQNHLWSILVSMTVICLIAGQTNFTLSGQQIDMRIGNLNNYFLFYIGAFAGTLACISLSMLIKKNHVLEYIGRHTLVLLGWQFLAFLYIDKIYQALPLSQAARAFKQEFNGIIATIAATASILGINVIVQPIVTYPQRMLGRVRKG